MRAAFAEMAGVTPAPDLQHLEAEHIGEFVLQQLRLEREHLCASGDWSQRSATWVTVMRGRIAAGATSTSKKRATYYGNFLRERL